MPTWTCAPSGVTAVGLIDATSNSGRAGGAWERRTADAVIHNTTHRNTLILCRYEIRGKKIQKSRWTPRALFGGDGSYDEAARRVRVDARLGALQCGGHQALDGRRIQVRRGCQHDVAHYFSAAFQEVLRIRQAGALEEEQGDPSRVEGDGEDGLAGAFGRSETDRQRVVVVVHQLHGARQSGTHLGQAGARQGGDGGGVLVEEGVELGLGRAGFAGGLGRGHFKSIYLPLRHNGGEQVWATLYNSAMRRSTKRSWRTSAGSTTS